jgi:hypothetical protein
MTDRDPGHFTVAAVVLAALTLFVILCKHLEDLVNKVIVWLKKADERISTLEVHEDNQDARLDAQGHRLDRQGDTLRSVKTELKEMGKDVGWNDDNRKTQVLKLKDPPDE